MTFQKLQTAAAFCVRPAWQAGLGKSIEEGWRQKLRQNVIVLVWGARLNAALGILV